MYSRIESKMKLAKDAHKCIYSKISLWFDPAAHTYADARAAPCHRKELLIVSVY